MNLKYYCPKCDSRDIEIIACNPPNPNLLSLDEAGKGMLSINTFYRSIKYKGTCKNCGYSREWSE